MSRSSPSPRADAKVSGPRRRLHHVGRALRVLALRLVSPVDRLVLIVNGKRRYPPIYLRRQAGPLHAFERVAGEYAGYLATLAGLTSSSHVLDVGCGAGALALALDERLGGEGRYRGFDVDRPVIAWAERHLSGKRFEFRHHDYWNATYNPHGNRFAAWPADDGWADIVVLKSIFTHLLPEDVEFYLAETSRVLAPNGTALINAFTFEDLDDAERRRFPLDGGRYRYAREGSPESAIAYRRSWLLDRFRSVGLEPTYLPGFWRPGPDRPIAFQDLVVARRPSAVA